MRARATTSTATDAPRAWQRMLSGRRLDLLDPSPVDIEIEDIAHGLARVARWNGQTMGDLPFNVAQHSLIVEEFCTLLKPGWPTKWKLAALLHDAPEYVIGDLISPFKSVIGEAYKLVESRIEHAVHLRFAVPYDASGKRKRLVKAADTIAAYHEAVSLAGFAPEEAQRFFGTPAVAPSALEAHLVPWPTQEVERVFLARFVELERRYAEVD